MFGAGDVLTGAGIHANHLALVDEQRHAHHGAGFQLGWLLPAGGRIAADARIGFHDGQLNVRRRRDQQRFVVPQRDDADRAVLQPLRAISHRGLARRVLLEAFRIHEMPEIPVAVEELHVDIDHVGPFSRVTGLEGALDHPPALEVADFHAIEGLSLARLDELILHDGIGVAVQQNLQSRAEFIGAVVGHGRMGRPQEGNEKRACMIAASSPTDHNRLSSSGAPPPGWQALLRQAVTDPAELLRMLDLGPQWLEPARQAAAIFGLKTPRGFVARMRKGDPADPLLLQVLPLHAELQAIPGYVADPVGDLASTQGAGLLHKYTGRALLVTTGACAVHCRYCFRREFPYSEHLAAAANWQPALQAIAADDDIHEVILSGGDPLSLADHKLRALTDGLQTIPHVRRLRIHTRYPIVLPERIDKSFQQWLRALPWRVAIVIHANHANEIDARVEQALAGLTACGATLLNQSVLLRRVNDEADALITLSEKLFTAGVLPYYLHLLDPVRGAAHFDVEAGVAADLMRTMAARLSGYLVPRLVREQAGAPYKTPVAW